MVSDMEAHMMQGFGMEFFRVEKNAPTHSLTLAGYLWKSNSGCERIEAVDEAFQQ